MFAYNLIWWIPLLLGFLGWIDYAIAFLAFFAITVFRALANLYRINALTLEQAELFPLRGPA